MTCCSATTLRTRRAAGKDDPRTPRGRESDGHIPADAFARLSVGLLVLKMTRQHTHARAEEPRIVPALMLAPSPTITGTARSTEANGNTTTTYLRWPAEPLRHRSSSGPRPGVLRDASALYRYAAARGERLSQQTLARQLRRHGHRFPREHLRLIAESIDLTANRAA